MTIPPADSGTTPLSAAVVVVTLARTSYLATCLDRIGHQTLAPDRVIVVDASADDATERMVTARFPDVCYLRNPRGAGTTGFSRSLGFSQVSPETDIVAFVDDDAYPEPDWLERLLEPYVDPTVGAVGGRALNGRVGEETEGVDTIGRLLPDGSLTGFFAADPGQVVCVDHLLGANMSYRRQAIVDVGGIRDGYPGTCLREETDLALRVRSRGWKLVFTPLARVEHVAAPYPRGRRFDLRYTYYSARNHQVLLIRVLGPRSLEFRAYIGTTGRQVLGELNRSRAALGRADPRGLAGRGRTVVSGIARALAILGGTGVGVMAGISERHKDRNAQPLASPQAPRTRSHS